MFSRKFIRSVALGTAALALAVSVAIGANAIVDSAPGTANAATVADAGQNQSVVGQIPQGWQSGSGTIITGAAADEATAVAVAMYPSGTVNRVLQLDDGSFAVKKIGIAWPHHIFVSADFQVTGAIG